MIAQRVEGNPTSQSKAKEKPNKPNWNKLSRTGQKVGERSGLGGERSGRAQGERSECDGERSE